MSPPPTNPGSNLRSTQQRTVDNLQHSGPRNHTLVPVYVYPEHLAAVQQFLLALGQPLILDPARHDEPPAQLEEVDAPVSPLSELQGAGDFDGGYSPDKSFEHELSMTSSLSRVSLSSSYVSSTPSNSGSTHRSRLFTSNSSSRTSPNPAARHSRMESLPINTVPSSAHQAASQNQNLKYYCVTIGKKTGIFWDEWSRFLIPISIYT